MIEQIERKKYKDVNKNIKICRGINNKLIVEELVTKDISILEEIINNKINICKWINNN